MMQYTHNDTQCALYPRLYPQLNVVANESLVMDFMDVQRSTKSITSLDFIVAICHSVRNEYFMKENVQCVIIGSAFDIQCHNSQPKNDQHLVNEKVLDKEKFSPKSPKIYFSFLFALLCSAKVSSISNKLYCVVSGNLFSASSSFGANLSTQ